MKTKNLLKKAFLLLALMGGASSAWGDHNVSISGNTATETWDFKEITFANDADVAPYTSPYDYEGLSCVMTYSKSKDYITSSGFHPNGGTQNENRYIAYTPSYNGTITVYAKANGTSNSRYALIATTQSAISSDPEVGTNNCIAVSKDLNGSDADKDHFSVSLTSGTTYYIEARQGITITKIVYEYIVTSLTSPTITTQPASANYEAGDDATALSVVATASAGTLTYQWYKNTDGDTTGKEGDKIEGATSATLATANISTASAGTYYYYCIVTDSNGSTASSKATITVVNAIAPVISYASATNTVTITCEGSGTIYYTLDNSEPTSLSNAYSNPFVLTNSSTVRAIAIKGGNASEIVFEKCKVDHSAIAKAVLGFSSGAWDDDAKEWKSADGTYKLIASNSSEIQYYNVFGNSDGFKINHTCTYTLKISDNIKVTSIKFVGISRGDAVNDATIAFDGFTPASGTIEKGTFVKTIEFTPESELGYGASINITTGGNQFGGYFEIYGTEYAPSATMFEDPETWDFTKWSDATKTDVLANSEKWNQYEKSESQGADFGDNGRSNITALSNNTLTSTAIISETNGLKFTAPAYGLGLMFNLPSTDIGTYHGSQFIWLYSNKSVITIPSVTKGSVIEIGVETHKTAEARGVTVSNSTQTQGEATSTSYQVCKWTVNATGDITITPSKGLHIYYITLTKAVDCVAITPANDKSTYVTTKILDFSNVEGGLKAYVATAAAAGKVTLEPVGAVPAGTPLMLVGTADTEYKVPVVAEASAPETNLFEAGDGTTEFNGSTFDYILFTDGKFYQIGEGSVPVGKAYLHCVNNPTTSNSRELSISFGGVTGVENVEAAAKVKALPIKRIVNGKLIIEKKGAIFNAAGQKLSK